MAWRSGTTYLLYCHGRDCERCLCNSQLCVCVLCVSFTSSLGVGYLMVCSDTYPNVLAFCFLDELQREFLVTYDTKRIISAVRPYSFIEFGECSALYRTTRVRSK